MDASLFKVSKNVHILQFMLMNEQTHMYTGAERIMEFFSIVALTLSSGTPPFTCKPI